MFANEADSLWAEDFRNKAMASGLSFEGADMLTSFAIAAAAPTSISCSPPSPSTVRPSADKASSLSTRSSTSATARPATSSASSGTSASTCRAALRLDPICEDPISVSSSYGEDGGATPTTCLPASSRRASTRAEMST
eukprot:UN3553